MGEGAKKKRAADARAARAAKKAVKATQPVEAPAGASTDPPSDVPTQSNATSGNSKKSSVPRVPSVPSGVRSVPTRQSTRSLGPSSTLGAGKRQTSDNGKPRPQRSATARAMALLQELQFSETEETEETERDPEGVFTGNNEDDAIMELDEDEDEDGGTSDDESSDARSDVEVIEVPVARKGLPKVSAAVRKKPPPDFQEEESSSEEFGECIRFLC
jgi:hypothetical protein